MPDQTEASARRAPRGVPERSRDTSVLAIVAAGIASLAGYGWLASIGDLRQHVGSYLAVHAVLFAIFAGVTLLVVRRPSPRQATSPGESPAPGTSEGKSERADTDGA